jgi:hypothetical protein
MKNKNKNLGKMHKLCHVAKIDLAMWINIKPSIMDDGDF